MQARGKLAKRLSAADMLRDEGNDKFSAGQFEAALDEYEFALDLFKYEMANLLRDQVRRARTRTAAPWHSSHSCNRAMDPRVASSLAPTRPRPLAQTQT